MRDFTELYGFAVRLARSGREPIEVLGAVAIRLKPFDDAKPPNCFTNGPGRARRVFEWPHDCLRNVLRLSNPGQIMPGMTNEPFPQVNPCYRCGQPAEQRTIGKDIVVSERIEQLPLCTACIDLMLTDFEAFWQVLRERHDGRQ